MLSTEKRNKLITALALLVVTLSFLTVITSTPATKHTIPVKPATPPDYKTTNYNDHAIRIELYIYKNNQLIYYDPNDPAVNNLLGLIAELVAGNVLNQNNNIAKDSGGSGLNYIDNTDRAGLMFLNFDSGYTYSKNLYLLPQDIETGYISGGGVSFDENSKTVTLSASINIQSNATIYGVGLYTILQTNNGIALSNRNYLLFYDPLSTPINVTAGDVITVVYKISAP